MQKGTRGSAADPLQRFGNALERIPAALRKILTYDKGKEISYDAALTLCTASAAAIFSRAEILRFALPEPPG